MRTSIALLCLLLTSISASTQVAINSTGNPPATSAMLDVSSGNKGILIPGISLINVSIASPVTSPATGLLIWNTNASVTGGSGIGFYHWNGSKWQSLLADNTGWRLGGNGGTNPSLHFIGTSDNQPLVFKVNNFPAGRIDHLMNNVFLGTGTGFSINGALAKRNTFVGDSTGYNTTTNSDNSYFGYKAGHENNGFGNSFFGSSSGLKMITGNYNSFFGHNAGRDNTTDGNSFFGDNAGLKNTGANNSIFGRSAGVDNVSGTFNSFFGSYAGGFGDAGSNNSFFGNLSGHLNTGNSNSFFGRYSGAGSQEGNNNSFFGNYTGRANGDGSFNVHVGDSAGFKSSGSFNTILGSRATTGPDVLSTVSNATAIGYLSQVDADNSMVLGAINGVNGATADIKVGIGTTTPAYKFHVVNTNPQDGGWAEGIVIESATSLANVGEAGVSFKNAVLPDNKRWTVGLNQNPQLAFNYGSSFSAGNTRMVVDTLGNVGVGTLTPAAKLDVAGTAKIGTNGTVLNNIIRTSVNVDLDGGLGMGSGASHVTTVAVGNAAVGATVFVSPQNPLALSTVIAYARVAAAGTVEIKLTNAGNTGVNHAAMDVYITVFQ